MNREALRAALVAHFDQPITPEVAAAIEAAAMHAPDESHDPTKFGVMEHGGYVIQAERLADVLPELLPLHEAHWTETEKHRHGLRLDPDYDAMLADERAGRLLQFTARKDGAIAAHLRMYVGFSRHTRTHFGQEDTLYLAPEHRPGAFLMVKLMRFAEQALLAIGVREIRADSKLINGADVLMRRLGYTPVALQFFKLHEDHDHVQ